MAISSWLGQGSAAREKKTRRTKESKKGEEEELVKDEAFWLLLFSLRKERSFLSQGHVSPTCIFPHILVTSKSFYLAVTVLFWKPLLKQKQSLSVSFFLSFPS
jgi:hypothetical protein